MTALPPSSLNISWSPSLKSKLGEMQQCMHGWLMGCKLHIHGRASWAPVSLQLPVASAGLVLLDAVHVQTHEPLAPAISVLHRCTPRSLHSCVEFTLVATVGICIPTVSAFFFIADIAVETGCLPTRGCCRTVRRMCPVHGRGAASLAWARNRIEGPTPARPQSPTSTCWLRLVSLLRVATHP